MSLQSDNPYQQVIRSRLRQMKDEVALVPVEMAILMFEVKSELTREAFDDIRKRNEWLRETATPLPGDDFKVPSVLFAFDSELSQDSACREFVNAPNLCFCTVVEKFYIQATGATPLVVEKDEKASGMLSFLADYWDGLTMLRADKRNWLELWVQRQKCGVSFPSSAHHYLKSGIAQPRTWPPNPESEPAAQSE